LELINWFTALPFLFVSELEKLLCFLSFFLVQTVDAVLTLNDEINDSAEYIASVTDNVTLVTDKVDAVLAVSGSDSIMAGITSAVGDAVITTATVLASVAAPELLVALEAVMTVVVVLGMHSLGKSFWFFLLFLDCSSAVLFARLNEV
jgi:hypothetical protein